MEYLPLVLTVLLTAAAVFVIYRYIPLKSRLRSIRDFSRWFHLDYAETNNAVLERIKFFKVFDPGAMEMTARNVLRSRTTDPEICIFDLESESESAIAKAQTVFYFRDDRLKLPGFRYFPKKEKMTTGKEEVFKYRPISFVSSPTFSQHYRMVGPDDHDIREFFTQDLLDVLAREKNLWVEGYEGDLLIYRKGRIVAGKVFDRHYKKALALLQLFMNRSAALAE